jgi:hypothetical protein
MKKIPTLLLALLMQFASLFAQSTNNIPRTLKHPFLLVTSTQIDSLRRGFNDQDRIKAGWLKLKRSTDLLLKEPIEIPTRGGNWEHYYINPANNTTLKTGDLIGDWKWKHIDPETGKAFISDPNVPAKDYDGVVISLIHDKWALATVELGLVYQLSKNRDYAEKAKAILLQYADIYPTLPTLTRQTETFSAVGQGKIHVQDLNEAQWLISIAQGTDLIWNALTDNERQKITNNLLMPAAQLIQTREPEITNIQCWRNAAVGMVGFLTGTQPLIDSAMKGSEGGFEVLLFKQFNAEGYIREQSPGYQLFALHPTTSLAIAARNAGYPVDTAAIKKFYQFPITLSNANGQIPAFNDSRPIDLADYQYLYEWAYAAYGSPEFADVLRLKDRGQYRNTNVSFNGWGFLYGKDSLAPGQSVKPKSIYLPKSGLARLSLGEGNETLSLFTKHSNQQRRNVHYQNAQLEFCIIKGGDYVSIVPGNINYASPLSTEWYRSSLAHNTLIIDEKNQQAAKGRASDRNLECSTPYIVMETKDTYDSVVFTRAAVVVDENTVLILDEYNSNIIKNTSFDIAYHQSGKWNKGDYGARWKPTSSAGYKHITDAKIRKNNAGVTFSTTGHNNQKYAVTATSLGKFDLITGYGPEFMGKRVPIAIFRFHESYGVIAYCISTKGEFVKVNLSDNEEAITVTIENKKQFQLNKRKHRLRITEN